MKPADLTGKPSRGVPPAIAATVAGAVAALLAACTSKPLPPDTAPAPAPAPLPAGRPAAVEAPAASPPAASARVSRATSPREYRRDAASHLYGLNQARIYAGRLPPMLYAVGVLEVDLDGAGQVPPGGA